MKPELFVILSLDVEEEGLFSGNYPSRNLSTTNVKRLRKLAPLSLESGFPLTLFCTHSVFASQDAADSVIWMREHCGAEIGAHLHHWSTPPLASEKSGIPERTANLPGRLLEERLESLLEAGKLVAGTPLTSFRMGRWDLGASLLPLLARHGLKVDSSICPLRAHAGGVDHFLAPAEPWLAVFPEGKILEAPITQIPVSPILARAWHALSAKNRNLLDKFHFFGALSANPLWHSDQIMRMAVRIHVARGGRVLSLFWHSSEMQPGSSPHIKNEESAEKLIRRINAFCQWLNEKFRVHAITASGLLDSGLQFPVIPLQKWRDW